MNQPTLTLKSGQILRQASEPIVSFKLPAGHLLLWCAFEKQSIACVIEAKIEKLNEAFSAIEQHLKAAKEPLLFLKFVFSVESNSESKAVAIEFEKQVENSLRKLNIKAEGKLVREGPLQGILNFESRRLQIEKKIRLMIVDDSKTIRDLLSSIFSKDSEIEIVAVVDHPHLAQKMIPELKPDVITLDIHMPDMDGVTLLKSYISKFPIPTVMISSITLEEGPMVLNALEAGAVDYIQKPSFNELRELAPVMIEKIKEASRSKVQKAVTVVQRKPVLKIQTKFNDRTIMIIGASTGGTEALKDVFLSMPPLIPPILVVQHIPPVFSKAFADRLNQLCPFEIKEAKDGDLVLPNQVLIAPGGFQMEVVDGPTGLKIKISDAPPVNRHKPSVDFLFNSLLKFVKNYKIVATVLTGMGSDGARAMAELKKAGCKTIAQNEATCVVFGMPKEAIRMDGASFVLPLDEIGPKMMGLASES